MIKIGDRVRNKVNGLTGLVTGRTEFLNGCRQFLIQQETLDKDGKTIDGTWWDEQYLEIRREQVLRDPFLPQLEERQPAFAGGPSGSTKRAVR